MTSPAARCRPRRAFRTATSGSGCSPWSRNSILSRSCPGCSAAAVAAAGVVAAAAAAVDAGVDAVGAAGFGGAGDGGAGDGGAGAAALGFGRAETEMFYRCYDAVNAGVNTVRCLEQLKINFH